MDLRVVRLLTTCSFLAIVGLTSAVAQAQDADESAWAARRIAVLGVAGIGTPYGGLGAAIDVSPVAPFSIAAGAGLGWLGAPQVAVMPRLRLGGKETAFATSAGFSLGRYPVSDVICLPDSSCNRRHVMAYWFNIDAGFELRKFSGFSLYAFGGAGVVLNRSQVEGSGKNAHLQIPYFGCALGYAF
jgi:hypothetical protein